MILVVERKANRSTQKANTDMKTVSNEQVISKANTAQRAKQLAVTKVAKCCGHHDGCVRQYEEYERETEGIKVDGEPVQQASARRAANWRVVGEVEQRHVGGMRVCGGMTCVEAVLVKVCSIVDCENIVEPLLVTAMRRGGIIICALGQRGLPQVFPVLVWAKGVF